MGNRLYLLSFHCDVFAGETSTRKNKANIRYAQVHPPTTIRSSSICRAKNKSNLVRRADSGWRTERRVANGFIFCATGFSTMHSTIAVVCARMFTRSLSDEDDLSIYLECAQGPMVHEVFAVACIVKQFRHTFND